MFLLCGSVTASAKRVCCVISFLLFVHISLPRPQGKIRSQQELFPLMMVQTVEKRGNTKHPPTESKRKGGDTLHLILTVLSQILIPLQALTQILSWTPILLALQVMEGVRRGRGRLRKKGVDVGRKKTKRGRGEEFVEVKDRNASGIVFCWPL